MNGGAARNPRHETRVLWWGRTGNYGPNYPRNRTVMACMRKLGWSITTFQPLISRLADTEARLRSLHGFELVWVPCFRHRDLPAATRWASSRGLPVVFDPLISAYDKQVFERKKFPPDSRNAQRLLRHERELFRSATVVIADTLCHADYFVDVLGCDRSKVHVLPVSAEEDLFKPGEPTTRKEKPEILFFGTFISLQGPEKIAQAALEYRGPPIRLTFLGDGPEREKCEAILGGARSDKITVTFEEWIPFHDLPDRIRRADACLGIFGEGDKSRRVIPNKVYQSLACSRPVITMGSPAYPARLAAEPFERSGMLFVEPTMPGALAEAMAKCALQLGAGVDEAAYSTYIDYFSNARIADELENLLEQVA